MFERRPTRIECTSPRTTTFIHTPLSSAISTSPTTCALSSMNAVGWTRGLTPRYGRSTGELYDPAPQRRSRSRAARRLSGGASRPSEEDGWRRVASATRGARNHENTTDEDQIAVQARPFSWFRGLVISYPPMLHCGY